MESTLVAQPPPYTERFRAAWRGEASLAWAFWSFYVLFGFALAILNIGVSSLLRWLTDTDLDGFPGTAIGQGYLVISSTLSLCYFAVSFILIVRCISNIAWKGWDYVAMLFLLGISTRIFDTISELAAVFPRA